VVVCEHFKKAIAKRDDLSLEELIKDRKLIAQILRQMSKWAKNTVSGATFWLLNHHYPNNTLCVFSLAGD
jgi:hypothetical protein